MAVDPPKELKNPMDWLGGHELESLKLLISLLA